MKIREPKIKMAHSKWQNWLIKHFELNVSNIDELINELRLSHKQNIIANDALSMIEGVLQVGNLQVRDVLIPRSHMKFVCHNETYREILSHVLESKHSRYPVLDEDHDEIEGILLAKDLLQYIGREETFNIDDIMRFALIVPESKRLNTLLTEFRNRRNHMAVIVNEYSGISGLITIEDVLEQIVGNIDDEHDQIDDKKNIIPHGKTHFTVEALTPIAEFNSILNTHFPDTQFDTIGGFVSHKMSKIPKQGEEIKIGKFIFRILRSDERRIILLEVEL